MAGDHGLGLYQDQHADQEGQKRLRTIQNSRSRLRIGGRGCLRLKTANCWRRAAISNARLCRGCRRARRHQSNGMAMGSIDSLSTRSLRSLANLLISSKNDFFDDLQPEADSGLPSVITTGRGLTWGQDKQWPHTREVSSAGRIVKTPHLGGLHRYERVAA